MTNPANRERKFGLEVQWIVDQIAHVEHDRHSARLAINAAVHEMRPALRYYIVRRWLMAEVHDTRARIAAGVVPPRDIEAERARRAAREEKRSREEELLAAIFGGGGSAEADDGDEGLPQVIEP